MRHLHALCGAVSSNVQKSVFLTVQLRLSLEGLPGQARPINLDRHCLITQKWMWMQTPRIS